MIKEILTVENEENIKKLSIRCDEIDTKKQNAEMRQIILDLKHTLAEHKDGCGLAASQIGYDKRIYVINFNGDIRTFINPVIADAKGLTLNRESCLSIPGKTFIRPRHTEIMVMYQTPLGKTDSRKMFGMAACVFQHELDHLDGLILSDAGLEIGEDFDNAPQEEKDEVIKAYLDSLDLKLKDLNKEIEENDELKQTNNAIKFMEKLQKGEITFEHVRKEE